MAALALGVLLGASFDDAAVLAHEGRFLGDALLLAPFAALVGPPAAAGLAAPLRLAWSLVGLAWLPTLGVLAWRWAVWPRRRWLWGVFAWSFAACFQLLSRFAGMMSV